MCEKKAFLLSVSMKNIRCQVYVHLYGGSGDILYVKCTCKAGYRGCCKHVGAALYQLAKYRQLDDKVVTDDRTCTDILQKWYVPVKGQNQEPTKFSGLQFYKADVRNQLSVEVGFLIISGKLKNQSILLGGLSGQNFNL